MDVTLCIFFTTLVLFHSAEFFFVAWIHPEKLRWESWLISRAYCLAVLCAVVEYVLECYWLSYPKDVPAVQALGIGLIVIGEAIRATAILTAGANFTHRVAVVKTPSHRFVSHGIYKSCRHPGYLGWFLWCLGTQVLLANPVCLVLASIIVWRFFADRIAAEEFHLTRFFPEEFPPYRERVRTYIPFIH